MKREKYMKLLALNDFTRRTPGMLKAMVGWLYSGKLWEFKTSIMTEKAED